VEDTRTDTITSTISWSIGGSTVPATINETTGRLRTTNYSGNAYVVCSVTGGVDGAIITDRARIQVNTGQYAYNPASSLTLKVVYEELPDRVVQEHTYSVAELTGRLPMETHNYTILAGLRFGCIRAQGFLFKDVMLLEGIDLSDVYQLRFTTADGYDNPVSYSYLYGGTRYYYPNYDLGGSQAERVPVPPLLATASNIEWNRSEVDPTLPMDEGTRFRLVFGPMSPGETNSSYQIYYINAITIVLNGAPPVDLGDGDGPKDGPGDGTGTGGGGGGANGETGSGVSGTGSGGAEGNENVGEGRQGKGGLRTPLVDRLGAGSAGTLSEENGASRGWRVYEMMAIQHSLVAPLEIENPLSPYALPIASLAAVAGAVYTYVGFRRRLDVPLLTSAGLPLTVTAGREAHSVA
jgi:hypothetical protein